MVPSLIKVGVVNLAVAVRARVAVLSVVAPRVVVQVQVPKAVKVVAKAVRVRIAIKARKSIMDSLLLLRQAPKAQEMVPNGGRQKGGNHSIKALENRGIQAKASDFDEFSSKSAIILDLQQFAAVLCCYRLMLRST